MPDATSTLIVFRIHSQAKPTEVCSRAWYVASNSELWELLLNSSPQQAARGALNARVHGGGLDDRQMLVRDLTALTSKMC